MNTVTQCLIVAAGKGKRIKGLGDLKPLINLNGKPIIERAIDSALASGVTDFVIVTGYKAPVLNAFLRKLALRKGFNLRLVDNPDYEDGNGVSVLKAEPFLTGPFYLSMCDHIVEPDVYKRLQERPFTEGRVIVALDYRLTNEDVDKKAANCVTLNKGKIVQWGRALKQYDGFGIGIYKAGPALFSALKNIRSTAGRCSVSAGMSLLAEQGLLDPVSIGESRWVDVNDPKRHKIAHDWLKEREPHHFTKTGEKHQKIVAVGHRGTAKFAPENTLAAHEAAFALGARCIEFDVRCTKDGHFILMHDATVNRTTNGRGRVKDLTLAQIRELDAGVKTSSEFSGEKVPTLREALRNVRGRFMVDIDYKGGPRNSADLLADIFEEEGFSSGVFLTVFARWHHFRRLQSLCPQYALRPHYISVKRTKRLVREMPLEIMGLRRLSFSQKAANAITASHLHLFCNVMGLSDNARGYQDSIDAGALFIQTDHLDRLIPYLEDRDLLETGVFGRDYRPLTTEPQTLSV